MDEKADVRVDTEELEALGLTGAATRLKNLQILNKKLTIAYENFKYVTSEQIFKHNERLRVATLKKDDMGRTHYDNIVFTELSQYPEVPPQNVLKELKKAKDLKCFDYFEIAKIESVVVRPDPILFGRVGNCADRFFITQWDDDIKFEDIIDNNEIKIEGIK